MNRLSNDTIIKVASSLIEDRRFWPKTAQTVVNRFPSPAANAIQCSQNENLSPILLELRTPEPINAGVRRLEMACKNYAPSNLCDVFIHGSQSTNDTTEFSDYDVALLVHEASITSFQDLDRLARFGRRLYRIIYSLDNLAHHGVMIHGYSSLQNYDESFLPVKAMNSGHSLMGRTLNLSITPNNALSRQNASIKLEIGLRSLEKRILGSETSLYHVKDMVSSLVLMALLWLEARQGLFLYKREALFTLMDSAPFDIRNALELATTIRQEWPRTKTSAFASMAHTFCVGLGRGLGTSYAQRSSRGFPDARDFPGILKLYKELIATTPNLIRALRQP